MGVSKQSGHSHHAAHQPMTSSKIVQSSLQPLCAAPQNSSRIQQWWQIPEKKTQSHSACHWDCRQEKEAMMDTVESQHPKCSWPSPVKKKADDLQPLPDFPKPGLWPAARPDLSANSAIQLPMKKESCSSNSAFDSQIVAHSTTLKSQLKADVLLDQHAELEELSNHQSTKNPSQECSPADPIRGQVLTEHGRRNRVTQDRRHDSRRETTSSNRRERGGHLVPKDWHTHAKAFEHIYIYIVFFFNVRISPHWYFLKVPKGKLILLKVQRWIDVFCHCPHALLRQML